MKFRKLLSAFLAITMLMGICGFSVTVQAEETTLKSWKFDFGSSDDVETGYTAVTPDRNYVETGDYGFIGIDDNAYRLNGRIDGFKMLQGQKITLTSGGGTGLNDGIGSTGADSSGNAGDKYYPVRFALTVDDDTYYRVKATVTTLDTSKAATASLYAEKKHPIYTEKTIQAGETLTTEFTIRVTPVYYEKSNPKGAAADGIINVCVLGENTALAALEIEQLETATTLWVLGDSTVTDGSGEMPYFPLKNFLGVGAGLSKYLPSDIAVVNEGEGGLNAADNNHFAMVKDRIKSGDFMYVEYGHNHKSDGVAGYLTCLDKYYQACKDAGATLVLVGPIDRHTYGKDGQYNSSTNTWTSTLGGYSDAAKAYVDLMLHRGEDAAAEFVSIYKSNSDEDVEAAFSYRDTELAKSKTSTITNVAFVDLNKPSLDWYTELSASATVNGETVTNEPRLTNFYFQTSQGGSTDVTHPNDLGVDNLAYFFFSTADTATYPALEPLMTNFKNGASHEEPLSVPAEIVNLGYPSNSAWPSYTASVSYEYPIVVKNVKLNDDSKFTTLTAYVQDSFENYASGVLEIYNADDELINTYTTVDHVDNTTGVGSNTLNFPSDITLEDGQTYKAYMWSCSTAEERLLKEEEGGKRLSADYAATDIDEYLLPGEDSDVETFNYYGINLKQLTDTGKYIFGGAVGHSFELGTDTDTGYTYVDVKKPNNESGSYWLWRKFENLDGGTGTKGRYLIDLDIKRVSGSGMRIKMAKNASSSTSGFITGDFELFSVWTNGDIQIEGNSLGVAVKDNEWSHVNYILDLGAGTATVTVDNNTPVTVSRSTYATFDDIADNFNSLNYFDIGAGGSTSLEMQLANLTVAKYKDSSRKTLTVSVDGDSSEYGTAYIGAAGTTSATVTSGSAITATAAVEDGYYFTGWYEGDTLFSTDAELNISRLYRDLELTAKFGSKSANDTKADEQLSNGDFEQAVTVITDSTYKTQGNWESANSERITDDENYNSGAYFKVGNGTADGYFGQKTPTGEIANNTTYVFNADAKGATGDKLKLYIARGGKKSTYIPTTTGRVLDETELSLSDTWTPITYEHHHTTSDSVEVSIVLVGDTASKTAYIDNISFKEKLVSVDTENEKLIDFDASHGYTYKIGVEGETAQSVTVPTDNTYSIPDEWIGKTLTIERYSSDGSTLIRTQTLTVPDRLSAPTAADISVTAPAEQGGKGSIIALKSGLEYAAAADSDAWTELDTETAAEFDDGTIVYIRKKATSKSLHGTDCYAVKVKYLIPVGSSETLYTGTETLDPPYRPYNNSDFPTIAIPSYTEAEGTMVMEYDLTMKSAQFIQWVQLPYGSGTIYGFQPSSTAENITIPSDTTSGSITSVIPLDSNTHHIKIVIGLDDEGKLNADSCKTKIYIDETESGELTEKGDVLIDNFTYYANGSVAKSVYDSGGNSNHFKMSNVTVKYVRGIQEQKPSAAINFSNERLTNLTSNAEYEISYTPDGGDKVTETITPSGTTYNIKSEWLGKTITIIKKGDYIKTYNSEEKALEIPSRPSAPVVTTDYAVTQPTTASGKGFVTGDGLEYSTNGTAWTAVPDEIEQGATFYLRKAATESAFASAPSEAITVDTITPTYTVIWKNGSETLETDENVAYNSAPSYNGSTPTREMSNTTIYTFSGWKAANENGEATGELITDLTQEKITENTTYLAQFTETARKYKITFVDEDGSTVLKAETEYEYGAAVTEPETPTKDATDEYIYTFAGWTPAIAAATENATYTAQFDSVKRKYTITWNIDGEETNEELEYGETPTHTNPTKAEDANGKYSFAGWSPAIETVTKAQTYTAQFDLIAKYTITYETDDGIINDSNYATVYYAGEGATLPTDVTKNGYTFAGWYDNDEFEGEAVTTILTAETGAKTYYAKWTLNAPTEYLITFVNWDNTELQKSNVTVGTTPEYTGATPTKAEDSRYTYEFIGWTPEIVPVSGIATYKAEFKQYVKPVNNAATIEKIKDTDGTRLIITPNDINMTVINLYAVIYNANGSLKKVEMTRCSKNDNNIIVPLMEPQLENGETYKLMLWDISYSPLIQAITSSDHFFN